MRIDKASWSGEGAFTETLLARLQELAGIDFIRVEDAPASRSEADYNFMSNEIFVVFASGMSMSWLEAALTESAGIGAPDYSDEGMLQYLRTERIIPPYQTRGYKLVELVRVYEAGRARA